MVDNEKICKVDLWPSTHTNAAETLFKNINIQKFDDPWRLLQTLKFIFPYYLIIMDGLQVLTKVFAGNSFITASDVLLIAKCCRATFYSL